MEVQIEKSKTAAKLYERKQLKNAGTKVSLSNSVMQEVEFSDSESELEDPNVLIKARKNKNFFRKYA